MDQLNSVYYDDASPVQGGGMMWDIFNIQTNPIIGGATLAFFIATIIIIIVIMTGHGDSMGFRVVMGLTWVVTACVVLYADYAKDGIYKKGTKMELMQFNVENQSINIPKFIPSDTWYPTSDTREVAKAFRTIQKTRVDNANTRAADKDEKEEKATHQGITIPTQQKLADKVANSAPPGVLTQSPPGETTSDVQSQPGRSEVMDLPGVEDLEED